MKTGLAYKFNAFVKANPDLFRGSSVQKLPGWNEDGPTDFVVKRLVNFKLSIQSQAIIERNKSLTALRGEREKLMIRWKSIIGRELFPTILATKVALTILIIL